MKQSDKINHDVSKALKNARSKKRSSAQLDRDIAEVLTRPRGHATKRDESLWSEVGLEDAPDREKAAFWREQLLNDVDDIDAGGVSSTLRPVLADVIEVLDPSVMRALKSGQVASLAARDFRDAVREIREQILNASIGQIVQYANAHYRSL
jgi:hypothetical protein